MQLICVGHAIKEVMSAGESLKAMANGAHTADVPIAGEFLVSDGGDGFLDAYSGCRTCTTHTVSCTNPLGEVIEADFLFDDANKVAVIESAKAVGLALVEPRRRNVMMSGTAGLADLIAAAKTLGAQTILVGLGGSATCDGGVGLLWRLLELTGKCIPCDNEFRVAVDMSELSCPDLESIREWLGGTKIIACIDVENKLLGENGSAYTFAPQKGAGPEEVEQLEAFMGEWSIRVERTAGCDLKSLPGSGAAGGLGFALAAVGAELEPGGRAMCRWTGIEKSVTPGSLVVTTEGRFDRTSLQGKAPWSVAMTAVELGAQAVIFCGAAEDQAVATAKLHGVRVIPFAADVPVEERSSKMPDMLAKACADFLSSTRKVTA